MKTSGEGGGPPPEANRLLTCGDLGNETLSAIDPQAGCGAVRGIPGATSPLATRVDTLQHLAGLACAASGHSVEQHSAALAAIAAARPWATSQPSPL